MKIEYNRSLKKYELILSFNDKCFTCGYKDDCCPLLREIKNQNMILKKDNFYIKDCKLYFYLLDDKLEKDFKGFYFGDLKDKGYSFDDKYRYE